MSIKGPFPALESRAWQGQPNLTGQNNKSIVHDVLLFKTLSFVTEDSIYA